VLKAAPFYSFDTSSLVHAWRRAYPPHRFAPVWTAFDALIDDGRMLASIEVFHELKKKDDDVYAWAKDRKEALFREIDDEVQSEVVRLMAIYPRLVDTKTGKSGGDPFVLAQALAGTPPLTIVSEELGGSEKSPKIPYVGLQEGLLVINLLPLIEDEDWTF
jgi:Domain of unknown function (DUF4411)